MVACSEQIYDLCTCTFIIGLSCLTIDVWYKRCSQYHGISHDDVVFLAHNSWVTVVSGIVLALTRGYTHILLSLSAFLVQWVLNIGENIPHCTHLQYIQRANSMHVNINHNRVITNDDIIGGILVCMYRIDSET